MTEAARDLAVLKTEIAVKRARILENLDDLSVRMTPENLIHTGLKRARGAARQEASKAMNDMNSLIDDLTHDSIDWARENRGLLLGGAVLAIAAVAVGTRRTRAAKPVPLYAAYNQEYRVGEPKAAAVGGEAEGAWQRVRGEAETLGDRAGELYYSARSKAAGAGVSAREVAHDAAERAREVAHDAAERAREAAERARETAEDAGQWAKRQTDEHPASVIIIGIAIGAIIGAMLPASRRENALLGSSRDSLSGKMKLSASQAIAAATASLEQATSHGSSARARIEELVDVSRNLLAEATTAAADRLRSRH